MCVFMFHVVVDVIVDVDEVVSAWGVSVVAVIVYGRS